MSSVSSYNLPFFLAASALVFSAQHLVTPIEDHVTDSKSNEDDPETMPVKEPAAAVVDIDPPADAEEAKRRVEKELEEERFARVEAGFAQPVEGTRPALIIVMASPRSGSRGKGLGPASCGKSTIGISLADAFNIPFIDGDSLHPSTNVSKMSSGIPLTDSDRLPWLALIRATAEKVCREEWITKEQGLFGVLGDEGASLNRDVEDLAELADWEFGEGWKWKKNLKKGVDESLGVPKEGLGRPAVVIACSALKKWYRDILRGEHPVEMPVQEISGEDTDETVMTPKPSRMDTYFVYCKGTRELLQDRIAKRKNHFMGAKMLDSQLATLEEPEGETGVISVDISRTPDEITKEAVQKMMEVSPKP